MSARAATKRKPATPPAPPSDLMLPKPQGAIAREMSRELCAMAMAQTSNEAADRLLRHVLAAGHYLDTPSTEECPAGTWLLLPMPWTLVEMLNMVGGFTDDMESNTDLEREEPDDDRADDEPEEADDDQVDGEPDRDDEASLGATEGRLDQTGWPHANGGIVDAEYDPADDLLLDEADCELNIVRPDSLQPLPGEISNMSIREWRADAVAVYSAVEFADGAAADKKGGAR